LSLKRKKNLRHILLVITIGLLLSAMVSAGYYTVKSGDTLWKIASKLGTDVSTLQKLNSGVGSVIYPGQVLVTPSSSSTTYQTYTVLWGDSLWKIANKFQATVTALKTLNGLYSEDIRPGQILKVPSSPSNFKPEFNQDLLARLVHAEAEGEPYEGQVAVAAVVLNRIKDSRFPNTTEGVIYEKSAFEVVNNGRIYEPASLNAIKATKDAVSGWDPSYGSIFFYNPDKIPGWNWILSRPIVRRIGNHVFAR